MIPQESIELFERFTQGLLSDKEVLEFEAKLSFDSEFKSHYDQYLALENDLKVHFQKNSLKNKLINTDAIIDHDISHSLLRKKRSITLAISIAAGIALFIGIYQGRSQSNDKISELWPYEEGLPVRMGEADLYQMATNAFKLGEWSKAISLFEKIDSDTSCYFQAISYYELKEFKEASSLFLNVSNESIYHEDAELRLAILYVLQEKSIFAKNILIQISENKQHKHYELALRILKKL